MCGVIVAVIAVLGAWRVPARLSILAAIGLGGAIFFWLVPSALVWFIDHVPGAALLRDSGKLTMLALPLYVASLGALPNLPAALSTVAAIVQLLPVPGRLAVLAPRDTGIDEQLVRAIDGRVAFFPERANLVEVPGGVAVDPYSKAVAMVESGELSVDGTVVDQASPQYRAALRAWKEHDMNQLTELGVGVVVVGGAIAAETNAPQPQVPWALTALWMACPLLAFAAIPRIARRSSPTKS